MNVNFFLVYSTFALLTVVITVFTVAKLGNLLRAKLPTQQEDPYHGITEVIMLFGCAILFIDLFAAVSAMLKAMDMQQVTLLHVDVIKILITHEAIAFGTIVITFFCSRSIFLLVKRQFKKPLNPIALRALFAMLFIIMIIATKPMAIELINYFQPSIQTPFFR